MPSDGQAKPKVSVTLLSQMRALDLAGAAAVSALFLTSGIAVFAQSAADRGASASPASPTIVAGVELPFAYDGPPPPALPATQNRDEQGRTTVRAVRLTVPLRVDGVLDEP